MIQRIVPIFIFTVLCLAPLDAKADILSRRTERMQERLQALQEQDRADGTLEARPEPTTTSTLLNRRDARRRERLADLDNQPVDRTAYDEALRQRAIARRLERREALRVRLELNDDLGDKNTLRQEVVRLVNVERAKVGLSALQYNLDLQTSAQRHAEDMLSKGYFSHYSLTGDSFVDRMKAEGYGVLHAALCAGCSFSARFGENIAKGQRTPQEVVTGWMNSEPHRKNILSPDFEEIGIGIAGVFWVQNFGTITFDTLP